MTDMLIETRHPLPDPAAGAQVRADDRAHVFHSWSAQAQINPMTITAAAGSYVWDGDGNRLLDFSSQLVNTNIGHQHPRVVAAIKEQADRLCTIAPAMANEQRAQAAELISEIAPDGFTKVFFTNGGADANEHAVRMARLQTGRFKVPPWLGSSQRWVMALAWVKNWIPSVPWAWVSPKSEAFQPPKE